MKTYAPGRRISPYEIAGAQWQDGATADAGMGQTALASDGNVTFVSEICDI